MEPEDLYGLPLERFVSERTALAKELRVRGERDEAARVAKLTKPSIPAWAVNQLVRTQPEALRALLAAGDELRAAQEDVVAGRGSPQALREATERERSAVEALTEAAGGLPRGEGLGLGAVALERVTATLHAAALDDDARETVSGGCLTRELQHVGLGDGLGLGAPAGPGGEPGEKDDREARERAARIAAAEQQELQAREAAERAAAELAQAERERIGAADALKAADSALRAARQRAKHANRVRRQAQQALERL